MNQARVGIDSDVRLHAEVPLITLLGLVHLGIAFTVGILGRARRFDDGRVHDAAFLEQQTRHDAAHPPAMEEALYENAPMRRFAGLAFSAAIPDQTTILNLRHLLEEYDLAEDILKEINGHLARRARTGDALVLPSDRTARCV